MDFLSDADWVGLGRILHPALDPFSPQSAKHRQTVNEILYGFAAQIAAHKRPGMSFGEAADCGEKFLQVLRASYDYMTWLNGLVNDGRDRKLNAGSLHQDHVDLIERHIKTLRLMQKMVSLGNDIGGYQSDDPDGPASKPWLHDAIARLYVVWLDAAGPDRQQREFFAFAFHLLGQCGAGVTENSVELSFRRHAKKIAETIIQFRKDRISSQSTP